MDRQIERYGRNVTVVKTPRLRRRPISALVESQKSFLRHFNLKMDDLAKGSVAHQLPQFTDHRITGVVIGDSQKTLVALHNIPDLPGLLAACGQRLLANDGQLCFKAAHHHFVMLRDRRKHHDRV